MSFPGKRFFGHWFWVVMFRYPKLRMFLTRLFVPSREIDIQIFGAPLHINTRDEIGLWRAARSAEGNIIFRHEAATLLNLALVLQPGDVFIDIGANVGLFSSVLARSRYLFPASKFIAIEANPGTAARLRQSVAGFDVEVLNIGASDNATELAFTSGVTSGVFKVAPAGQRGGVINIECERLDALPLPLGDLVLKIDVEEHELPVLNGAARLFDQERIKVIYLDGYGNKSIPDLLRSRGFALFNGQTLEPCPTTAPDFSLLAVHRTRIPLKS
ncbi:MAG TPA: FkbM family methyltransferase [Chthoniobacterales bacterium]|nr:FkbM family methyltransferase [Chthoniobacterales bacterium]